MSNQEISGEAKQAQPEPEAQKGREKDLPRTGPWPVEQSSHKEGSKEGLNAKSGLPKSLVQIEELLDMLGGEDDGAQAQPSEAFRDLLLDLSQSVIDELHGPKEEKMDKATPVPSSEPTAGAEDADEGTGVDEEKAGENELSMPSAEDMAREKAKEDYLEAARQEIEQGCFEVASLIPASEWAMPMTMWVLRGGISGEMVVDIYQSARERLECDEDAACLWDGEKEHRKISETLKKMGNIVVLEQAAGAKEVAKAAMLAGKFVVWVARASVDQYAKENAAGVAHVPPYAIRVAGVLRRLRTRGFGTDTPTGEAFEDWLDGQCKGKVWRDAIDRSVSKIVDKVFKDRWDGPVVSQRALDQIERCLGFVSKEYPDVRQGDPSRLSQTVALAPQTRKSLERLCKKIKSVGKGAGVLLHGLPGTGKTMLARVVAIESGRSWVQASYAQWQACDHLGEHLAAMAESFEEAIAKAPSVMFIDELDSIGSREGPGAKRNSSYTTPVINAMLEWVQQAIDCDVVIIGASNYPESIDPALVRPGRIGEWIEVEYPGKAQRAELLAKELPEAGDAMSWASRIGRASPAKIMEMVHLAREIAKERGAGGAGSSDLAAAMQTEIERNLKGRSMKALAMPVAVGLCAKAWAIEMARPQGAGDMRVASASIAPGVEEVGRLEIEGSWASGSADVAWARVQVALAPAAARAMLAREKWSNAGLSVMADIDHADRAAARASLRELSSAGLAMSKPWRAGSTWLSAEEGVEALANTAWEAALESIKPALPAIRAAAQELASKGELGAERLMELLGLQAAPIQKMWVH